MKYLKYFESNSNIDTICDKYRIGRGNKIYWLRLREIYAELGLKEPDPETLKFKNYELIY